MNRRDALKAGTMAAAAALTGSIGSGLHLRATPPSPPDDPSGGPFSLPPLPYSYSALEPSIDAETMHLHHDAHHAGYVAKLNEALATDGGKPFRSMGIEELLRSLDRVPESIRTTVRNNGGGHANHTLFWSSMGISSISEPMGPLATSIDSTFGSLEAFKEKFSAAALGIFGSGWAWLSFDPATKRLLIETTPNQDSPLMSGRIPLLGLDVWEHAYYLKYHNKRADYIKSWWVVVNWHSLRERYREATKS